MAKELPYFQFEPAEYITGDISFCSLETQGLFINLCSYYWQRSCNLTKDQFLRRINNEECFNELVTENVIILENNTIKIGFLDEQFYKATNLSNVNKINGSKGGRPPKINPIKSQLKAKPKPIKSELKGIIEDKIKEDNINYNILCLADDAWIESVCRLHKTNIDIIKTMLSKFDAHLISVGTIQPNLKEFKSHFNNWLRKQILTPKRKQLGI